MQFRIINANIVSPDEVVGNASLTVEDGVISRIGCTAPADTVIDAAGAYLMPGFIDIHSDQIEQAIEPRPGSVIDIAYALQEQDRQLVNNGITTMYHSLSMLSRTSAHGRPKAAREDQILQQIVREIINPESTRLIDHELHIRLDMTSPEIVPTLMRMMDEGLVSMLSFCDHTPGQGQFRERAKQKAVLKSYDTSVPDEEIERRLDARCLAPKIPRETLIQIAELAKKKGVPLASHDDDSTERVDFAREELSAVICEFPVELAVARYAKSAGMVTLGGAPNVLRGKSHTGNMSAIDGIFDGSITALCSDYYTPSMLQAVSKLHKQFGMPLHECVNLVTLSPAKAVGLDERLGTIAEGKVADLILVDLSGDYPKLTAAFKGGNVASMLYYA